MKIGKVVCDCGIKVIGEGSILGIQGKELDLKWGTDDLLIVSLKENLIVIMNNKLKKMIVVNSKEYIIINLFPEDDVNKDYYHLVVNGVVYVSFRKETGKAYNMVLTEGILNTQKIKPDRVQKVRTEKGEEYYQSSVNVFIEDWNGNVRTSYGYNLSSDIEENYKKGVIGSKDFDEDRNLSVLARTKGRKIDSFSIDDTDRRGFLRRYYKVGDKEAGTVMYRKFFFRYMKGSNKLTLCVGSMNPVKDVDKCTEEEYESAYHEYLKSDSVCRRSESADSTSVSDKGVNVTEIYLNSVHVAKFNESLDGIRKLLNSYGVRGYSSLYEINGINYLDVGFDRLYTVNGKFISESGKVPSSKLVGLEKLTGKTIELLVMNISLSIKRVTFDVSSKPLVSGVVRKSSDERGSVEVVLE